MACIFSAASRMWHCLSQDIFMPNMCVRRYEIMSTDEGVLEELDMVLIGIDRPTYGLSDPDPDRQDAHFAMCVLMGCTQAHAAGHTRGARLHD